MGDLPGAATWLRRYRQATSREHLDTEPYLALMNAYARAPNAFSDDHVDRTSARIGDVLQAFRKEGLPPSQDIILLLVHVNIRSRAINRAAYLLTRHAPDLLVARSPDLALVQVLLRLYTAYAQRKQPQLENLSQLLTPTLPAIQGLPGLRDVLAMVCAGGNTKGVRAEKFRSASVLNNAIGAALAMHDYPAARIMVDFFDQWRLEPNRRTHELFGHLLLLPGVIPHPDSKVNISVEGSTMTVSGPHQPRPARDLSRVRSAISAALNPSDAKARAVAYRDAQKAIFSRTRANWRGASTSRPSGSSSGVPVSGQRSMSTSACSGRGGSGQRELPPVRVVRIPHLVPYSLGLALQEHLVATRAAARAVLREDPSDAQAATVAGTDTLLLLQHAPVYTEGRRTATLTPAAPGLRALGADYVLTKRGGQITYHGPGQLVGYPILDTARMGLSPRCYVDSLQTAIAAALPFATVPPPEDHTGVWADEYHKVAAIGVQIRHRITSHGFALNVHDEALKGFRHIVACGIQGRSVTSCQSRTTTPPVFEHVVSTVVQRLAQTWKRDIVTVPADQVQFHIDEHLDAHKRCAGLGIALPEHTRILNAITIDGTRITSQPEHES